MKDIINKIIEFNKVWSDPEHCLRAVKQDDRLIKYVKNPTPEMGSIAINRDINNCDFIILPESKDKLEKFLNELSILLYQNSYFDFELIDSTMSRMLERYEAYSDPIHNLKMVKQFSYVIKFIVKQTPEICAEAIKQNSEAYMYVRLPETEPEREKFIRKLGFLLL